MWLFFFGAIPCCRVSCSLVSDLATSKESTRSEICLRLLVISSCTDGSYTRIFRRQR